MEDEKTLIDEQYLKNKINLPHQSTIRILPFPNLVPYYLR